MACLPDCITTDRGTQFTFGMLGDWCQKQAKQKQANGKVERIHRTLKEALQWAPKVYPVSKVHIFPPVIFLNF